MRRLLVVVNLLLLLAIFFVALYWQPEPGPSPGSTAAAPQGGDFSLMGTQGPLSLRDFRGKLVLLYFGYTYCPDICPTSLVVWANALNALAPHERAQVQPIFVSVDPERDSLARLAEYTAFFHPTILGATGTLDQLREVSRRYGAVFARQENISAGGYVVDHTAATYLIAPDGRLVESLAHATPPEQLVSAIRRHFSSQ